MKTKTIKQVAIIGSGIMGSRIACHFANIGVKVLLLDISPNELSESEKKKGLSLTDKIVRNRIVTESFFTTLKTKPSSLYLDKNKTNIELGNLNDDIKKTVDYSKLVQICLKLEKFC